MRALCLLAALALLGIFIKGGGAAIGILNSPVLLGPLFLFHLLMGVRRVRRGVEMGE